MKCCERWRYYNVNVTDVANEVFQLFDEDDGFLRGLEHFPISNDAGDAHYNYLQRLQVEILRS